MSHDWPTIRAWAHENDIDCPRTGKVPGRVVDAYYEVHEPPVEAAPDEAEDDMTFDVTVRITGADEESLLLIEAGLVNALWHAYTVGREAERRVILQQLGVEG